MNAVVPPQKRIRTTDPQKTASLNNGGTSTIPEGVSTAATLLNPGMSGVHLSKTEAFVASGARPYSLPVDPKNGRGCEDQSNPQVEPKAWPML